MRRPMDEAVGNVSLDDPGTLVAILRDRAERQSDRLAYAFLPDRDAAAVTVTYAQLDARAQSVAGALGDTFPDDARGAAAGGGAGEVRRALLLYPPGLDFLFGLFGCMYAGVVPVPAYPPTNKRSAARLGAIAADARAGAVLTTASMATHLERLAAQSGVPAPPLLATDRLDAAPDAWRERRADPGAVALLQYTSGSTGDPRGVVLTHANLLANQRAIEQAFSHDPERWVVGWLPVQHDMGLIGNVLQPLYLGAPCALMSPLSFLREPLRWLAAISEYRAATSGGPDFAYALCTSRISEEERAGLDLSGWELAFNGSEPIHAPTLEEFATVFSGVGFRREAFHPCYGLAEATLLVTAGDRGAAPAVQRFDPGALEQGRAEPVAGGGGRPLVGCGRPPDAHAVAVVDPEARRVCAGGRVGEIWVAGPSVAQGYHDRRDETEATFAARLADGRGPYLRTGDLGFLRHGELFVTGRLKDLVIVRGRNHYPQDVERTAVTADPAVRPGGCAAFGVEDPDGGEQLVLVAEVETEAAERAHDVVRAIRGAVSEEHALVAGVVALVRRGAVPKTSSGKVQRRATREAFLDGTLALLAESREGNAGGAPPRRAAPVTGALHGDPAGAASWLVDCVARTLDLDGADPEPAVPLTRYGLDSLLACQLQMDVEAATGVRVPLTRLLDGATVGDLAALVAAGPAGSPVSGPAPSAPADGGEASGLVLSHGQEALWFMHQVAPGSAINNLAFAARLHGDVDVDALAAALGDLTDRHAALRTTFETVDGRPTQRIHARMPPAVELGDATGWAPQRLAERLRAHALARFDLEGGPLVRALVLRRGPRVHVLALATHHIVCDFASLVLLVGELGPCYDARRGGRRAALPAVRLTHADHARWERAMLAGAEGERLWTFWERRLRSAPTTLDLPTDRPYPRHRASHAATRAFALDRRLGERLAELAREQDTTLYVTLLAAFGALLCEASGQDDVLVASPVAGRAHPGLDRLVGSLAHPVPLRVTATPGEAFAGLLARTRTTVHGALEHADFPFPLLVQRLNPAREPGRPPLAQVMFDYFEPFAGAAEGCAAYAVGRPGVTVRTGGLMLESLPVDHAIDQFDLTLALARTGGELAGALHYRRDLFDEATAAGLQRRYQALLEAAADRPESPLLAALATGRP